MSDIEKVIDRVRKLLALSTSANEHEAAAAAARAAELMREYDLEEAQMRVDDPSAAPAAPIVDDVIDVQDRKLANWRVNLAGGCARSVGAHVFTSWLAGRRVVKMYGRKTAIQTATYLFKYLANEVDRLANEAYEKAETSEHGRTWKNSFRLGAVSTISNRLYADRRVHEAAVKAAEASTALALIRTDALAVNDAWEKFSKGFGVTRGGRVGSGDGYRAGKSAGEGVALGGGRALGAGQRLLS